MRLLILALTGIFLQSCAPRVSSTLLSSYKPKEKPQQIEVISLGDSVSNEAKLLAKVEIKEGGLTVHCDYNDVLQLAKDETRHFGGNILKITELKAPDFYSSCYRLSAHIYYLEPSFSPPQKAVPVYSGREEYSRLKPETKPRAIANEPTGNMPHFRILLDGAYAFRTAPLADGINNDGRKLYERLKGGRNYALKIHYYFNDTYGLGVILHRSYFDGETTTTVLDPNFGSVTLQYSAEEEISFSGLGYITRIDAAKNDEFEMGIYAGVGQFNSLHKIGSTFLELDGINFGMLADASYNIGLSDKLALNIRTSYQAGVISTMNVNDGITQGTVDLKDSPESLNQVTFGGGITFKF